MNNIRLLVTKKISSSLVLQAGLKGLSILEKEFIRIVPLTNDQVSKKINKLIGGAHTVAFTSRNAVAAIAKNNGITAASWKIFCIDGATKNEIKKYFADAT